MEFSFTFSALPKSHFNFLMFCSSISEGEETANTVWFLSEKVDHLTDFIVRFWKNANLIN